MNEDMVDIVHAASLISALSRPMGARLGALAEIGIRCYIRIRNEGEGENNYNYRAYS